MVVDEHGAHGVECICAPDRFVENKSEMPAYLEQYEAYQPENVVNGVQRLAHRCIPSNGHTGLRHSQAARAKVAVPHAGQGGSTPTSL